MAVPRGRMDHRVPRPQGVIGHESGNLSTRMALFVFFCCLFAGWLWYYSSSEVSVPNQQMPLIGLSAEQLQLVNSYLQQQGLANVHQLAAMPFPAGEDIDDDLRRVLRKVVSNVQLWEWLDEMQLTVVYSSLIGLNVQCLDEIVKIQRYDTLQAKLQSRHGSQVLHKLLAAAGELEHKWSSVAEEQADDEQGHGVSDVSDTGSSWIGFCLKLILLLVVVVIVCFVSVGVIYVTVIAPIIAVMTVVVVIVLEILFLPLTLLTGQRPNQINIQEVFNEVMPRPLRFFLRLFGASRIDRSGPSRRHTGVTNQRRPGRAQESRGFYLGLKDRITRNYLDYNKCRVLWSHDNYEKVGCLTVMTVKLYCANGSPYSLQASDEFVCTIRKNAGRANLPFVLEPACPVGVSELKVSFTVRAVGMYIVRLSISGMPIGSSQFERSYLPGPVDVSRTIVLSNSQTMVARRGVYNAVSVDAKDSFGNPTEMDMKLLDMVVVKNDHVKTPMETELVRSEKDDGSYELLFKLENDGVYYGTVKYLSKMVGTESFTIICLEGSVVEDVEKCVCKRSLNNWYEARLVPVRPNERGRRVYCYLTPRQLQVREFFLKFIPKRRLFTCRVCPSTKIQFLEEENQFTIDDGYQEAIKLESEHRGVIGATFSKYLLGNIGGSENFQSKRSFFFGELSKNTSVHRRIVNVQVERSDLLHNAYKILKKFAVADWKAQFHVSFIGEEGLDWGGVQREFLHLLCCKIFDSSGLFTRFTEDQQALVHPNPNRPQQLKLKYFELAGKVVGKCLFESALGNPFSVTARFTRSFLAQIIGLRVNYRYFETDDPELFTTKVKYIQENDVDGLDLVFAEELYSVGRAEPEIVPLKPGGECIEVTNANKQEYLNLLAQYKLVSRIKEELEYFLKGLNEIVPENLLSIFDENELELLMCGLSEIDIDDWKSNSAVHGNDAHFQTMVSWFWTAASSYSQEERARLLQFTTGSSQLPSDGFCALNPKFTISHAPIAGRLPSAHTCFNELCLPDHATYEAFEAALKLAITEGSEGFGVV